MQKTTPGFEAWYAEKQEKMKADAAMKFFIDLRNAIEKQAAPPAVAHGIQIHSFSSNDMPRLGPAPKGATSFVVGHARYGNASGWIVPRSDGTEHFYQVTLPPDLGSATSQFLEAPGTLSGQDVKVVLRDHIVKLQLLINEAKKLFL